MIKDLNYWKENCAENYMTTPISVLRYITELEDKLEETINSTRCSLTLEDLKVNRFEVIDKVGRAYVNYCDRPLNIETSLQDDDRTLKVFLDD